MFVFIGLKEPVDAGMERMHDTYSWLERGNLCSGPSVQKFSFHMQKKKKSLDVKILML